MADYPLTAEAIKNQYKRAGIHFVVAMPDRVTSHYLLKGLLADPEVKVVQVCKEEPILDVMGIEHHLIERDADAEGIAPAIEKAFANSSPTAILIGREPR
jgi:sulfopyruvate decarboxylase TPP-binding subunit